MGARTQVADIGLKGMIVTDADGNMIDTINAPGVTTDAFKIDGTVTGVTATTITVSVRPSGSRSTR